MPERATGVKAYNESIFFNCPFDDAYKPIFEALVFAAFDCGYVPRCALEADDAGQVRFEKILKIIRGCRLGVHDISRTELDSANKLPRFNMPFELGLFMGAAKFGVNHQRQKVCLVLDRERYRFQKFISDIAGQDIRQHGDDPERAIEELRAWLAALPREDILPGGTTIAQRYREFRNELPGILNKVGVCPQEMIFADYTNIVSTWLSERPRSAKPGRQRSRMRSHKA
ncbi:MAG: hypothetical protein ACK4Y5_20340 [Acetobacteraceae bacterium]|jgi:hypothetical protein